MILPLIFCDIVANGQNTLQKTKACGISHDKNLAQDFSGADEVHERDKTMDTFLHAHPCSVIWHDQPTRKIKFVNQKQFYGAGKMTLAIKSQRRKMRADVFSPDKTPETTASRICDPFPDDECASSSADRPDLEF
jgi:hypothetical protein